MSFYRFTWPLLKMLSPEAAHAFGLAMLKVPVRWAKTCNDPFAWRGLTFRNRVGIAAGFDKNAVGLRGLERMGIGFVEIGTILNNPWPGNPDRPRMERLYEQKGIWNRLGFPSEGVGRVAARLRAYPRNKRQGMVVACNIGPHPGHLKQCSSPESYLTLARTELLQLIEVLHDQADLFVINLSSPNTAGLRGLLSDPRLAAELVLPIKKRLLELGTVAGRTIPLWMKLPPDNPDKQGWTKQTLEPIIAPLLQNEVCDGFVAVNTSTRLTQQLLQRDTGGVSGGPLLPVAVEAIRLLRELTGPDMLIVGCGGITQPADAVTLQQAGAQLVELYSGMIFAGPSLPAACAEMLRKAQT